MKTERRLTQIFVELADTLVDEFDALDFLHTLTERSVELLHVEAAGVILSDQHGHLQVVASTSSRAQDLELFELQSDEGPCLDCFTTGVRWPTWMPLTYKSDGPGSAQRSSRLATDRHTLCRSVFATR